MNTRHDDIMDDRWSRRWRLLMVGLGVLVLCSCRGPAQQACPPDAGMPMGATYPALLESAYTGVTGEVPSPQPMIGPPGMEQGVPMPYQPGGPWAPPGTSQPWPADEYVRDGGDRELATRVGEDWEVHGLDLEDTVVHYDTLDGRTLVEPSNRVHIYAPRFGAVRKVDSLRSDEQVGRAGGVHLATTLMGPRESLPVGVGTQNAQAIGAVAERPPVIFRGRQGDGVVSEAIVPRGFQDDFLPFENLNIVRMGVFEEAEAAQLAKGTVAAQAWSHDKAVQVVIDRTAAMAVMADQTSPTIYTVGAPPGNPKLRVVKVASTQFAEPGDEVAFTIRFDNVGNQTIGNVTLIDNLSPRLEYIPDSAQCSLEADFFTEPNKGDSLVVRCEVIDPLPSGEGGVVRFRCRVR